MATDELILLPPFKFRGIEFPCTEFDTEFKQRLANHAFPNRDGAQVESTGRDPIVVKATIPFLTGAQPGPNESWSTEPLFPTRYRQFLDAFADRTAGDLQHPFLGKLRVKPDTIKTSARATTRDGVYVDATWIETIEVDSDKVNIGDEYPVAVVVTAAAQLDKLGKKTLADLGVPQATQKISFTDLARSLQAIPDQLSIFSGSIVGKLNNIVYHCDNILLACKRVPSSLNWQLVQLANNLKAAVNDVKSVIATSGKDVALYTVSRDATLAAIAVELGRTLNELMLLNAPLIRMPTVPKGTKVRYYK